MTEEEFTELYSSLREHIFRYAKLRLRTAEQALDVVADTFEIAWRMRTDLLEKAPSPRAYVFGIAKNRILQEKQKVGRKHHDHRFAADFVQESRHNPQPDIADGIVDAELARAIVATLSDSDRELLILLHSTDLTPDDACDILGISKSAYAVRVFRLRQRINARGTAEEPHSTTVEGGKAR